MLIRSTCFSLGTSYEQQSSTGQDSWGDSEPDVGGCTETNGFDDVPVRHVLCSHPDHDSAGPPLPTHGPFDLCWVRGDDPPHPHQYIYRRGRQETPGIYMCGWA